VRLVARERRAAFSILAAVRRGRSPSSPLTAAAAPLIRASQCTTGSGTVSPEIGKFSTAFDVSAPHSCFSGIGFSCWLVSRWLVLGLVLRCLASRCLVSRKSGLFSRLPIVIAITGRD
jgi:hypothetical protein